MSALRRQFMWHVVVKLVLSLAEPWDVAAIVTCSGGRRLMDANLTLTTVTRTVGAAPLPAELCVVLQCDMHTATYAPCFAHMAGLLLHKWLVGCATTVRTGRRHVRRDSLAHGACRTPRGGGARRTKF